MRSMPIPASPAPISAAKAWSTSTSGISSNAKWPLSLLQPPTVFKDYLFLGWAGKDWAEAEAPPGTIFALDARTGALRWTFDSIPEEIAAQTGTANVWASMSVDAERNMLYIPVSSPSPNFFGGNRLKPIPLGTSVTALDIETGKVVWSRQLVHHDLWDYDTNSAPTLIDIVKDGMTIPALVQTSKQGFLYVLNRTHRRAGLSDRGAAGPEIDGAGRALLCRRSLSSRCRARPSTRMARRLQARRLARALAIAAAREGADVRGPLHAAQPAGIAGLSGDDRRRRMGRRRGRSRKQTFVVNSTSAVQIYQLLTRADYDKAVSGGRKPAACSR